MDGKPYHVQDIIMTRVIVYHAGTTDYVCDLEEIEKGVFERQMKEGLYDLELANIGTGIADKWMRDQEVRSGETLEKIVNLGGKGKIRIKLIADGKPYSDPEAGTRVIVSEAGTDGGMSTSLTLSRQQKAYLSRKSKKACMIFVYAISARQWALARSGYGM